MLPNRMTTHARSTVPVISGFHPDPSICRVENTFYLVCSSFEYAPGVPIFRSSDLRSWEQIGNVLDRPAQLELAGAQNSGGIFAPTLRHHGGRFWMITTNLTDGGGHLLVSAEDAAGPWSDPVRIVGAPGIDPDIAWDDDGTCYLTWSKFAPAGSGGVTSSVLDPATGTLLSEPQRLWQGTGGKFPEGPHRYQIGEHWYLLIAEGGTERGHAVTVARSTAPFGPFEASPHNPLITARGTQAPVQNTGHADLVQRSDGTWAMVYLGVRARGSSPEFHVLGRETFATEIAWDHGWPVLGAPIELTAPPSFTERLDAELPLSWISPGQFPATLMTRHVGGWQLAARVAEPTGRPAVVGRRQQHLCATVTATVSTTGVGGITIWLDDRHHLDLEVNGDTVRAVAQVGTLRSALGETPITTGAAVELQFRIEPATGSFMSTELGPDALVAGVVQDERFVELGRLDGRYLSTEVAGGFTGRIVGCFSAAGELHITSFSYRGADDPAELQDTPRQMLVRLREQVESELETTQTALIDIRRMRSDRTDDDEHDPEGTPLSAEWSRLEGLRRAAQHRLTEVDRAIANEAGGTYGICERCGRPIAPGRLEALPTATTCVACAGRRR